MRILIYFILFLSTQLACADIRFLSISDFHYGSGNISGDGKDTGKILLNSSLKKFSQLSNQVDFILTLGDFSTHMLLYSPKKSDYLQTVFEGLYEANKQGKPMFYITGNNDSLKGNYQPFSWKGITPLTYAKHWQGACIHCKDLIIDGKHMEDTDYYSSYLISGNKELILIALNTTQFAQTSLLIPPYPQQEKDASQQLKWLESQLKTHHAKQLLIAMHIPPGKQYNGERTWREIYLKQFINLLNQTHKRYGHITLLTAHTHMDDIRKLQLKDGTNIYAYATPSISRNHHNNPAMKIFDLDNELRVKDYTTYYTPNDAQWGNEYYQAMKHIYPQCRAKILDKCMDSLTKEIVCKKLKIGVFYGAKSSRVDSSVCKTTYPVNLKTI